MESVGRQPRGRRWRLRSAIASACAAVTAAFAFAGPALAHERTFTVILDLEKGKFSSSWSCSPECDKYGGYHSLSEEDHFALNAHYDGLKIPSSGPAVTPGHPISMKAAGYATDFENSTWALSGTYWTQDNPNAPLNCTGGLSVSEESPHLVSAPGNTASDLKLYVGAARTDASSGATFVAEDVKGTNCGETGARWHAFWPQSWACPSPSSCGTPVEDMLTAHVTIPLSTLRTMRIGFKHRWNDTFNQQKAKSLPPPKCTGYNSQGHCTESLDWTGRLTIWRTG